MKVFVAHFIVFSVHNKAYLSYIFAIAKPELNGNILLIYEHKPAGAMVIFDVSEDRFYIAASFFAVCYAVIAG